jgi:hypothetical protein
MKLISYLKKYGREQLAVLEQGMAYDVQELNRDLKPRMDLFLRYWKTQYPMLLFAVQELREGKSVLD